MYDTKLGHPPSYGFNTNCKKKTLRSNQFSALVLPLKTKVTPPLLSAFAAYSVDSHAQEPIKNGIILLKIVSSYA